MARDAKTGRSSSRRFCYDRLNDNSTRPRSSECKDRHGRWRVWRRGEDQLRALAVEGKANAALICFLAKQLELPRHSIVLERGSRSRDKVIRVDGLTEEEVRRRMRAID